MCEWTCASNSGPEGIEHNESYRQIRFSQRKSKWLSQTALDLSVKLTKMINFSFFCDAVNGQHDKLKTFFLYIPLSFNIIKIILFCETWRLENKYFLLSQ